MSGASIQNDDTQQYTRLDVQMEGARTTMLSSELAIASGNAS